MANRAVPLRVLFGGNETEITYSENTITENLRAINSTVYSSFAQYTYTDPAPPLEGYTVKFQDNVRYRSLIFPYIGQGTYEGDDVTQTQGYKDALHYGMVGDMDSAFARSKIKSIEKLPNEVTNLCAAFAFCDLFNCDITIPNTVTNLDATFKNCVNFNANIDFSSDVQYDLNRTFKNCINFNGLLNNNNFNYLDHAFESAYSFNQSLKLPTYIGNNSFSNCYNFNSPFIYNNQNPQTIMLGNFSFSNCRQFNQSFENLTFKGYSFIETFYNCQNFDYPINFSPREGYSHYENLTRTFAFCYNFNHPIKGINNIHINQGMEMFAYSGFNQPLTLYINNFSRGFEFSKINSEIDLTNSVDLYYAFGNCAELNKKIIFNNANNLDYTFSGCEKFNQSLIIPNTVVSMRDTFWGCHNYNQETEIPDSVIDMSYTFIGCSNLNSDIKISHTITDLIATFKDCKNFKANIDLSYTRSINSAYQAFYGCENINIPPYFTQSISLQNLTATFYNCYNLRQPIYLNYGLMKLDMSFHGAGIFHNITIPSSVINITSAFVASYFEITHSTIMGDRPLLIVNRPDKTYLIEIEEGVKRIESGAFVNTGNTIISVPESIEYVDKGSFGSYNRKTGKYSSAVSAIEPEERGPHDDPERVCYDGPLDTSEWGVKNIGRHNWSAETLYEEGFCVYLGGSYHKCSICGAHKWIQRNTSYGPHKFIDEKCIYCGLSQDLSKYFVYIIVDGYALIIDVRYDIWDADFGPDSTIEIPTEIKHEGIIYPTMISFEEREYEK